MMQNVIDNSERRPMPLRTREEAAELLRALRAAYQSLPPGKRGLIKEAISRIAAAHSAAETDEEKRCSALPC